MVKMQNIEDVVRHQLDPTQALANCDDSQIDFGHESTYEERINKELLVNLSSLLSLKRGWLSVREREVIRLSSLTNPASVSQFQEAPGSTDWAPTKFPLVH